MNIQAVIFKEKKSRENLAAFVGRASIKGWYRSPQHLGKIGQLVFPSSCNHSGINAVFGCNPAQLQSVAESRGTIGSWNATAVVSRYHGSSFRLLIRLVRSRKTVAGLVVRLNALVSFIHAFTCDKVGADVIATRDRSRIEYWTETDDTRT